MCLTVVQHGRSRCVSGEREGEALEYPMGRVGGDLAVNILETSISPLFAQVFLFFVFFG